MVKGKMYRLTNLNKNKRNNFLASYNYRQQDNIGWLWSANWATSDQITFSDGDVFVCLGKKEAIDTPYGIDTWYEALGPDGKIHRITPSMRTSYFRNL
jgi:hypothetical protein